MPDGVPEGGGHQSAGVLDAGVLHLGPGEEVVDDRSQDELPPCVTLRRRQGGPLLFEVEEPVHAQERLARHGVFGHDAGLPELASAVAPTSNFQRRLVSVVGPRLAAKDGVVDDVGVGLDVAAEPAEHLAHGGAGVLGLVLEEDVVPVGEDHEKVALAAGLTLPTGEPLGLNAHAGGVGRQAEGLFPGLFGARIDDAPEGGPDVLGVTAHRAVVELDAVGREHPRLAVEGQAPAVLAHKERRDHRGSQKPSLDQLLGLGDRHQIEDRLIALGVFAGDRLLDLVGRPRDDQTDRTRATIAQPETLFEADALGLALEGRVEDLDALLGHLLGAEVATTGRLGPRLGGGRRRIRGGRLGIGRELRGERVELG